MKCEESIPRLDAYLDGELDLTASLDLEGHLTACPACRRRLAERETLKALVREEAPRFEASPFLATRIRASLREEKAGKTPWWRPSPAGWIYSGTAAAALLALILLSPLWTNPSSSLEQEAIADHVRSLQVSHLLDVASTDQHTVKPWFAGKLDYSPQVVDLLPSGYPLVGGRLDVLARRDVAALVYQRRKHFINLFVYPADADALKDRFYRRDGYHVLEWSQSGMNYLAVSELNEEEFRDFASLIREQTR